MNTRLGLSSSHLPGATLISVDGTVDAAVTDQLDAAIRDARRAPDEHLVLDLTDVPFMDSFGLRVVMRALLYAREHGGSVRLACLQPPVERMIRLAGVDDALPLHATATEALRAALSPDPPTSPPNRATGA